MDTILNKILGRVHYVKFKYPGDDMCTIFPILYYTNEYFVLFNKGIVEVEESVDVILILSDEMFEFVITGKVIEVGRTVKVNITDIRKYKNNRKNKRFSVNIETTININDKQYKGKIINISEGGALISIDSEGKADGKVEFVVGGKEFTANVLREEIRENKKFYGIQFIENCNIKDVLKREPGFPVDELNDMNINVIFDDIDDLNFYHQNLDKKISVNFINITTGIEPFIIHYFENNSDEMIFIDIKEEKNLFKVIERLEEYIATKNKVVVIIQDDYNNKTLEDLTNSGINYILKPFISEEIKNMYIKMV
jgi:hypothetical protein